MCAYIIKNENSRRKIMINAIKENLSINKIVGSKNFQITIEGDSIIPDTKPDILSEISSSRKYKHIQKRNTRRKNKTRWKCKHPSNVLGRWRKQ